MSSFIFFFLLYTFYNFRIKKNRTLLVQYIYLQQLDGLCHDDITIKKKKEGNRKCNFDIQSTIIISCNLI